MSSRRGAKEKAKEFKTTHYEEKPFNETDQFGFSLLLLLFPCLPSFFFYETILLDSFLGFPLNFSITIPSYEILKRGKEKATV